MLYIRGTWEAGSGKATYARTGFYKKKCTGERFKASAVANHSLTPYHHPTSGIQHEDEDEYEYEYEYEHDRDCHQDVDPKAISGILGHKC